MPTVGQITGPASMGLGTILPLVTSLSNPVSAAIAAGVGLIGLVDKIGQGRKAANKMTGKGGPQDILNKQLAAISASESSTEEKAQATDHAWRTFLQAANQFAQANPKQAKVVQQAIHQTPQLTDTVRSLLGGRDPLATEYTSMAAPGMQTGFSMPNPGPSTIGTIAQAGLTAGLPFLTSALTRGNTGVPGMSTQTGTGGFPIQVPPISPPGAAPGTSSLMSQLFPNLISAGTSIVGGILASNAAGNAAETQSEASLEAARLQAQAGQEAIQFQRDALAQQQANAQPWLDAGAGALTTIGQMTAQPFTLPTPEEAMQDPGIQFQLQTGQRQLEQYLRSRGKLLSGKAIKDIETHAQGVASTGYQDVTNRALQVRQANLNPLFSLAGLAQDTTGALNTNIGQTGARVGDIGMSTAANVGAQQTNAAAARASGTAAQGNIWGTTIGNIGNNVLDQIMLQQILQQRAS